MSDTAGGIEPADSPHRTEELLAKVETLLARAESTRRKDMWDRLGPLATLMASVAAFFGLLVSVQNSTEDMQQRLQLQQNELVHRDSIQRRTERIQILSMLMPVLTGPNEQQKSWAVQVLRDVGGIEFAARLAGLHPSSGTAAGLRSLRSNSGTSPAERAVIDTVLQSFPANLAEALLPDRMVQLSPADPWLSEGQSLLSPMTTEQPFASETRDSPRQSERGKCQLWETSDGNFVCMGPCPTSGTRCATIGTVR